MDLSWISATLLLGCVQRPSCATNIERLCLWRKSFKETVAATPRCAISVFLLLQSMNETVVESPARKFQFSLGHVFALITISILVFSGLGSTTRLGHIGSIAAVAVLACFAWLSYSYVLCSVFARSSEMRVLIFAATPFAVFALFAGTVQLMSAYLHANPPPRPMFHNHFRHHEVLPRWMPDWAIWDEKGTGVWADHRDNVLVAVLGTDGSAVKPQLGRRKSAFWVPATKQWIPLDRRKDVLVVIGPRGATASFPLVSNAAKGFHEPKRWKYIKDSLAGVQKIVETNSRAKLTTFLREQR